MRSSRWVSLCIALAVLVWAATISGVAFAALAQQVQPMVAGGASTTFGLLKDGTVVGCGTNYNGESNVATWTDIKQVTSGGFYSWHTVGLKENGTVVAVGDNSMGACDVSGWTNIKKLAVLESSDFTVGIRSNDTLIGVGDNGYGQLNFGTWTNVKDVACGFLHTVALRTDGSVIATGYAAACGVAGWHDVKSVAAGAYHSVGLRNDGSVVAAGDNAYGQCEVTGWHDIIAIAAGFDYTLGLKSDSTVVACGERSPWSYGQTRVSDWGDIVGIACGQGHAIGLKANGTVVTVGLSNTGQGNTEHWRLAEPDDNIPGLTPAFWQTQGWGSKIADKYDVYRMNLTKDVPVQLSCVRTSGDANYNLFLYGPGAWNVWNFSQWLPGWQWDKSGDQTETISYTPAESGTHYLLVDCNEGSGRYKVIERCSAKLNAHAPVTIKYGQTLTVMGPITAAEKFAPLGGQRVTLDCASSLGTTRTATATSTVGGSYLLSFKPDRAGRWTCSLLETDSVTAANVSGSFRVVPVLTTPKTTSTPRASRYFTLTGTVAPSHAAKIKVEIRKGSKLVRYRTYTVYTKSNGKWSLRVKLGHGDWRIRAGHTDADHAQGWSPYKRIRL